MPCRPPRGDRNPASWRGSPARSARRRRSGPATCRGRARSPPPRSPLPASRSDRGRRCPTGRCGCAASFRRPRSGRRGSSLPCPSPSAVGPSPSRRTEAAPASRARWCDARGRPPAS
ncbi:CRISPR-associated protein Cas5 [Streptomyces sp. NBC_00124]|uniref:CRISPR-associated protein Cas5 n=1 Tax=Streptomyces sp. NBC_00124 TaxID=2975662 RepID=UPI00338EC6E5